MNKNNKLNTYTVTIEIPYTHTLAVINTTTLKVTEVPLDLIAKKVPFIRVSKEGNVVVFEGHTTNDDIQV